MKNLLILVFLCGALFSTAFASNEIRTKAAISEVTVYRQRAMIQREASIQVKKGDNLIVFQGLSNFILKNSITVKGEGKGFIQSVRHRVSYQSLSPGTSRMTLLGDSLEIIRDEMTILDDEIFINKQEENLLLQNQQASGTQQGVDPERLKQLADLFYSRLGIIKSRIRKINQKKRALTKLQNRYQNELSAISAQRNQQTQEVAVAFEAEEAGTIQLVLSYLVSNAGWEPFYDIRVQDTDDPLQFFLKANVVNNTGLDWDNVDIQLSTLNNAVSHNAPALSTWYLNFYYPRPATSYMQQNKISSRDNIQAEMSNTANVMTDDFADDGEEIGYAYEQTTVSNEELGLFFDIATKYDIPADGQPYQVDIQVLKVEGTYKYLAVPKLDRDAFLVAKINRDLLRGRANIYFEGTYVGETYVNTDNPRDSMLISLGRDPKVQVQRERVEDFTRVKVIGGNARKTFKYETTVKNNKNHEITIQIEDQIPVSGNQEIIVELLEANGASVDPATGKVIWNLTLQPGKKKDVTLQFQVKYPKDKSVPGL